MFIFERKMDFVATARGCIGVWWASQTGNTDLAVGVLMDRAKTYLRCDDLSLFWWIKMVCSCSDSVILRRW